MLLWLLKRVLAMVPTLFGITFLTFLIITCAPGDPVALSMGAVGAESGEGGGGESQARKADAVKAKKKLLGIVEPERVVRVWAADAAPPEPRADGRPGRPRPLERTGDLGEFDAWPRCLALDGARGVLYVGTEDGRVAAFDAASGEERPAFRPPPFEPRARANGDPEVPSVGAIAASADGALVAAADTFGRIRVFAAADGAAAGEPPALGRPFRDLAYLPDGRLLSACDDSVIRVHDGATGAVVRELKGHTSFVAAIAVAPDGARAYSVGYDRKIRAWNLDSGAAREIGALGAAGNDLALSKDGTLLAAVGEDRGARVLDVRGDGGRGNDGPAPVVADFPGAHSRGVTAVAFLADASAIVTGAKDGTLRVWRIDERAQSAETPDTSCGEVGAVVVSADGASMYTASRADRKTPVVKRYVRWLGKLATLDFDRSFIDDERVIDKIAETLPVTIGLNLLSILVIYLVAVPVGVLMAVRRGKAFDRAASAVVFLLWSMPSFWFATLLIQQFASPSHFDWFPAVGLHSMNEKDLPYVPWLADWGAHLVLPLVVLTYGGFAGLSQYMRTSLLDSIAQDYVRTARAKGLSERVVVFKHALRNSLVTLVTLVGTLLPAMIGGSVIIEQIFTIEGMGRMGFLAIQQRDYPVIMAITTMSAVLTLLGMLVSDVLYAVVDPRISHQ